MLLFVLLNVVHQLIVGKDLFIVVIIDRANKLHVSRLPEEFTFVFTNTFADLLFIDNIEDSCTMSLPIFLTFGRVLMLLMWLTLPSGNV
jgi:hypothetical protein